MIIVKCSINIDLYVRRFHKFLANVNVLRYVCYMQSAVRLSSVCRLLSWCTRLRRLNFSVIFFTIR